MGATDGKKIETNRREEKLNLIYIEQVYIHTQYTH